MAPFVAPADNQYLGVPLENTWASQVIVIGWELPDKATGERMLERVHHLQKAWALHPGDEDELWGRILGTRTQARVMKRPSPVPNDVEDSFDLRALARTASGAIREEIFRELDNPPFFYKVEEDLAAGVFPPPPPTVAELARQVALHRVDARGGGRGRGGGYRGPMGRGVGRR